MMKPWSKNVSLSEVHGSVDTTRSRSWWRQLFVFFGPAYLVSVGYMDPGNWATDLAGGSQFGYSLLWVLLMSNGMAILLQNLSARLGIVRGRDLAQANREVYPGLCQHPPVGAGRDRHRRLRSGGSTGDGHRDPAADRVAPDLWRLLHGARYFPAALPPTARHAADGSFYHRADPPS